MDLGKITLTEALEALRSGMVSAQALTQTVLERVNALNPKLNAYISVQTDEALAKAEAVDRALSAGTEQRPLAGVPLAIKDVLVRRGVTVTAGSRMLKNFQPTYTATAVQRLEDAGAIIIGQTNCDEFAFGVSGEYSAFGPTRNPWNLRHVPGGSSSGSAAAVAAGLALGALGSDTGGSVRQPAAMTNLVGIRPTYGRVSRYGLIATASSIDTVGVFGRTVEDAARLLQVVAGHDRRDATSLNNAVPDYVQLLRNSERRLRIGVPREYFSDSLRRDVRAVIEEGILTLRRLGHEVLDISLPHTEVALATYYLLNPSEASSNLARFDGIRFGHSLPEHDAAASLGQVYAQSRAEGFGPEVKRRILLGTFALSSGHAARYYHKAQEVRTRIRDDFRSAFSVVDAIVAPSIPEPAWEIGAVRDPLSFYLADIFMTASNLAGLPAVSVPAGFVDGLPVGLQIIGQSLGEADMLWLAQQYEAECEWVKQRPNIQPAVANNQ